MVVIGTFGGTAVRSSLEGCCFDMRGAHVAHPGMC